MSGVKARREARRSALPVARAGAFVVAAFLALAPAVPATGQQMGAMDGDTLVLTLEDALRLAEANNPAYRQRVNEVGLNGVDTRATWANNVLPTARLNLFDTNYQGNVQRIGVDDFGNPVAKPDADWFFRSGTTQSLSLSWNLQGSSIFQSIRGQELTNRNRSLAEDEALSNLATTVRRQYFDVLQQRSNVELEEALATDRQVELESARRLFALAGNTRVDVLQAELAIEQQALQVQEQRNAYEQAKLSLRTTLGDDGLAPFRLSTEPLPVFDPAGLDADELVERAVEVNPGVRQARASIESQRVEVRSAKNSWWPSLSVNYNLYRRSQEKETQGLFDVPLDEDFEQSFGVSLGFPFFNNYFGNQRSIETAEVGLDNARESLRQTRLETEEQVRTALLGLRTEYESLRLAQRSLEIAGEALELAREEYRLGTRTFQELRQAVQDEADARRGVLTARFGFVDALLNLEDAVGAPVRRPAPEGGPDASSPGPVPGDGAGAGS